MDFQGKKCAGYGNQSVQAIPPDTIVSFQTYLIGISEQTGCPTVLKTIGGPLFFSIHSAKADHIPLTFSDFFLLLVKLYIFLPDVESVFLLLTDK